MSPTLAPLAASCLREDIAVSVGVVKHRYPINIPFLVDSDLRSFPVDPLKQNGWDCMDSGSSPSEKM
jgi:hypothetical protein